MKNKTITLYDDKFMRMLSLRGAFPVDFMLHDPQDLEDWNDGLPPCPSQNVYFVEDVLRVLMNLRRYNFIELIFGLPKEEVEPTSRYLF